MCAVLSKLFDNDRDEFNVWNLVLAFKKLDTKKIYCDFRIFTWILSKFKKQKIQIQISSA